MKAWSLRVLCLSLFWEVLALAGPAGARPPHLWQMDRAISSFARFADHGGSPLERGAGVLLSASGLSLARAVGGFVLGTAGGYLLGAGALLVPGWQAVPIKVVAILRAVPPLALIFLLTFLSPGPNVATLAYVSTCLALLIAGGLHETSAYLPEPLLYQVRALGGGRLRQIRDVALPAMWFQTRRISLWACSLLLPFTFGSELINSQAGGMGMLGYQAFIYANLAQLLLLAVLYIFIGHILSFAIRLTFSLPTHGK